MRIRSAGRSDLPALGLGDPSLVEYLRHWLFLAAIGDAAVLVAEEDDAPGTTGPFGRVVVDLARGQVLAVEVAEGHRRSGVGRRLMDAARDAATERGHRRLTLLVEVTNSQARAFYTSLGWQDDGAEVSSALTAPDGSVAQPPVACRRLVLDLSRPPRPPVPPRRG